MAMASNKVEDPRCFDWDDSALIKAYNKGTKIRENALQNEKNSRMGNSSKENSKEVKRWKIGDYCRVKYNEDNKMYEAFIDSINDGVVTVKFLGYGGEQLVTLKDLKKSGGKKARRRQKDDAYVDYSTAASESHVTTTTDGESEDHQEYLGNESSNRNEEHPAAAANSCVMPPPPNPPQFASNHSHGATCYAPAHLPHSVPTSMPFLPGPPAPPMPHCPSVAQNPSLSAMLVSWYMAGYYTGLNQAQTGQNGCQCSKHCCNHSNRCCH